MTDVNSLPQSFLDEMEEILESEYEQFLDSYECNANRGIRINRNKVSKDNDERILRALFDGPVKQVPWTENGYYLPGECSVSHHPYYAAGLYYLQEPSAMSPASLLPVDRNDIVLDLCAAPGGKATELAAGAGFVLANDISATRARALLKNLELSGSSNFAVTAENPEHLAQVYGEYFDAILVDAPCSGEGMFRKDPSLILSYREKGPYEYHKIQVDILKDAVKMLKPGGHLLYSTCTFSRVEDEGSILELLKIYPDIHPVKLDENKSRYFSPGLMGLDEAARLFPHRIEGEGHFLCLLKKDGESKKGCQDQYRFIDRRIEDRLYKVPECFRIAPGIRYLRTGVLVGEEKKGKLIYSHPYAMTSFSDDYDIRLDLSLDDDRVLRYLKGETIILYEEDGLSGTKGDCLVCVDSFPLGFARLAGGKLKNNYPAGLIWH